MTTIPNIKITRSNAQKTNIGKNITSLNQLVLQPGITVKKKVVLKNYGNKQKNNQVSNKPNKVANSQIKFTYSQAEKERKVLRSKDMTVKKKCSEMQQLMLIQNVEFYPDRCKREVQASKIKLQPKHQYKVVGTTNKRKRGIPHKEIHSSCVDFLRTPVPPKVPALPVSMQDLSLSSLVQLAEDQGLDDEDFMEILTCPSPVWWEENSDEDDISSVGDINGKWHEDHRSRSEIYNNAITDANGNKICTENNRILKNDVNILKKFATKRSKLESILGKIKCKNIKIESKTNKEYIEFRKSSNINEENINYGKEDLSNIKRNTNKVEENINHNKEDGTNFEDSTINSEFSNRTRKISVGGLSDISINEDELLYSLESIEIPVKDINKKQNVTNTTTNVITMMDMENNAMDNTLMRNQKIGVEHSKSQLQNVRKENMKVCVKNVDVKNETDSDVPTDLPVLTKYPLRTIPKAYESPISIGSPNSDTMSFPESDSISDTNIKFLDEYVDSKKEKVEAVNINKYGKGQDGELVTVYQIVTNKPNSSNVSELNNGMDLDIEEQIKVNLVNKSPQTNIKECEIGSFSKTRKPTFRSRSKYKRK